MTWVKYSRCTNNGCVWVRWNPEDQRVEMRNDGVRFLIQFTDQEWQAFIDGVRDGDFNLDRLKQEWTHTPL